MTPPPTTKPPTPPPTTKPPVTPPPTTKPPVTPPPTTGPSSADEALAFYPQSPNSGGLERFAQHEQWLGRDIEYFTAFGDGNIRFAAFNMNLNGQLRADRLGQCGRAPTAAAVPPRVLMPLGFGSGISAATRATPRLIKEQWDALINNTTVRSSHPSCPRTEPPVLPGLRRDSWSTPATATRSSAWRPNTTSRVPVGVRDRLREVQERVPRRGRCDAQRRTEPPDRLQLDPAAASARARRLRQQDRQCVSRRPLGRLHRRERLRPRSRVRCRSAYPPAGPADGGIRRRCSTRPTRPGLDTAKAFAIAHGKRISLPEWGLSGGGYKATGECGGDNPVFITNIHDWLSSRADGEPRLRELLRGQPRERRAARARLLPGGQATRSRQYFGN